MTDLARAIFAKRFPDLTARGLVTFPPTSTELLLAKHPKAVLATGPKERTFGRLKYARVRIGDLNSKP